jgi:rhodanese-related sulfurtransferase
MKGAILCMIVVLAAVLYFVYTNIGAIQRPKLELSIQDARSRRFQLIIDVRSPKEREELGYYPNSIPIAVDQLQKDVPFLIGSGLQSKQSPILVYSNGDRRAQLAAEMLYHLGYTHVRFISTSYLSLLPGSQ